MQPPESEPSLPSFLVIGAIKAATSWISHHLRQSPAIFVPIGEPHYFTREYERGLNWYRNLFASACEGQIIGEKTADYLANPEAPGRASTLLPKANLIVSLRNPVERAYSDYCMLFRRGEVTDRIGDYLDPSRAQFTRFLENGLYYKHISRWLDHYPEAQMLVLTIEDVTRAPDESLRKIGAKIGLKPDLIPKAQMKRVNDSGEMFVPLELRRLLSPFKKAVAPVRGTSAFKALRRTISRPIDYPGLSLDLSKRLSDFYRDDLERLGNLLRRDLGEWSNVGSKVAA